nr:prepilin-type N-terminal cleavage/methylation domain-containing protein [Eubacterium sp. 1001713B170207_170306_E7]
MLKNQKGFTVVELIVVLVILAILAAFTIPAMLGFVEDAKGKAAIAEAREVYVAAQTASTEFKGDNDFVSDKLIDVLKNDLGDLEVWDIRISSNEPPIIWDPNKGNTGRIGVLLDSSTNGIVKWVEYIDASQSYLVKITPGGSAEVTKIK